MVQLLCKLCLNSIPSTEWKTHITQKEHLQQLPCKLVIKGSFNKDDANVLYQYFGKFGGIRGQNVTFRDNKTVIELRFWDARVYSEIIHQEHTLFDQKLEISWYKNVKSGSVQYIVQDEEMCNEKFIYRQLDIINSTKGLPLFSKQVKNFLDKLEAMKIERDENRKVIHEDLISALSANFANNKFHFFGSSTTDLDIHNSDLNIFLDNTDSELETLKLIKDLISGSEHFCSVCLTSHMLLFQHSKSQIACELNIKNEIPVGNSELIRFYLSLDDKIRELILIVKFWADCYNLRRRESFSSYAIYLLVIFYLQQEPYKLPSVNDLQKDIPSDEIDGWNCAFGPVEFVNTALQQATLLEVLSGFFKFYGRFDYMSYVISPYFGFSLEKIRFLKRDLPGCFEYYMNQEQEFVVNSGICIQDPFEHATNVSISVSLAHAGKFSSICRKSFRLLMKDSKNLLYDLFMTVDESAEFSIERSEIDEAIKNMTSKVLTDVFSCKVEEIDSKGSDICFVCEGRYNIWDNRFKNLPSDLPNDLSKEIAVTSLIVANSCQDFLWRMRVELQFDCNTSVVSFLLIDEEHLTVVSHLSHFLYLCLEKFLVKTTPLDAVKTENQSVVQSCKPEKVFSEESVLEDDVILVSNEVKVEVICVDDDGDASDEVVFIDSQKGVKTGENLSVNVSISEQTVHLKNVKNKDTQNEAIIQNNLLLTNKVVEIPSSTEAEGDSDESRLAVHVKKEKTRDNSVSDQIKKQPDQNAPDQTTSHSKNANNPDGAPYKVMSKDSARKLKLSLTDATKQTPSFVKQASILLDKLKMSDHQIADNCNLIKTDLSSALCTRFPDHEIFFLGSVVTNSYIVGNEIDIYVTNIKQSSKPDRFQLESMKSLLFNSGKFSNVRVIPESKMKIPVIKCVHEDTQMCCELNIKDKLPVKSTALIHFYSSLHENLQTLMIIIRVWIDFFQMNEENCLYSYILNLMVIFYLQQEPYKLIPVAMLQKNRSDFVDGWNCAFAPPELPNSLRDATLLDLVKGFFKFYSSFDYFSFVISPFYGSAVAKTRFVQPYNLPQVYNSYIKKRQVLNVNSAVCVQDPFEHSKNVAASASLHDVGKFAALCRGAIEMIEQGEGELLHKLVTVSPVFSFAIEKLEGLDDADWIEIVKKIMAKTLTDILRCQNVQSTVEGNRFEYHCQVHPNILTNRTNILKSLLGKFNSQCSAFEKENAISSKMIQRNDTNSKMLSVEGCFYKLPCRVVISVNLSVYCHFLYTRLSTFLTSGEIEKLNNQNVQIMQLQPVSVPPILKNTKGSTSKAVKRKRPNPYSVVLTKKMRHSIMSSFKFNANFERQFPALKKMWWNSDEKYKVILKELQLIKPLIYNNIYFYGSVVIGFNVKHCIVDVYIEGAKLRNENKPLTAETLQNIMRRHSQFCEVSLSSDDTVVCKHHNTGYYYSLSLNSKSSVYSTLMIKYYTSLDPKLCELIFIIKIWAENHELVKVDSFSNYAIYLMQQEPYKLPSVEDLQKGKTEVLDGWNMGFTPLQFVSQELVNVSEFELLLGFFKFYRDFDYDSYVISPYFGSPIAKTCFVAPYDLPDCLRGLCQQLPISSGFCVQDLFIHVNNVTECVNLVESGRFTALCRNAIEHGTRGERNYFLPRILGQYQKIPNNDSFEIEKKDEVSEHNWLQNVKTVMYRILTEVLCCKVVSSEEAAGRQTCEVHYVTYSCMGQSNFWDDRSQVLKKALPRLHTNCKDIDKETCVSWSFLNDKQRACSYSFRVDLSFTTNPWMAKFDVVVNQAMRYHIVHFLYVKILKALEGFAKTSISGTFRSDPLTSAVCEPYKIAIRGSFDSQQVNKMNEHFGKFGEFTMKKGTTEEKKSKVEYIFRSAKTYRNVIQEVHILFNRKLKLVPLAPLNGKIPNANFKDFTFRVIFNTLGNSTFDQQMETLKSELQVDKSQLEMKKKSITEDLTSALIAQFNDLRIHFFGLDFKDSVVSIFLDNVKSDDGLELTALNLTRVLMMQSGNFADVSVTLSKVPFLMCKHTKTQTSFDLNIRNKLPVKTSDLVKYYLNSDAKLEELVIVVKLWADCYDLIDRDSFSFYSLCLLIIFYLQQEPFKIPSVADFQKNTSPDIINGWNCAYAENMDFALRSVTLLELVKGFFDFYSKFDYISYVISPFSGKAIEKSRFLKPYILPEDYKEYVKRSEELPTNCGICIQDLFQLTNNVSASFSLDFAASFAGLCGSAVRMLQKRENQLLYKLFLHCRDEFFKIITKNDNRNDSEWCQLVKTHTWTILSDVLKCKMSHIASFGTSHCISYACVGQYTIWGNRIIVEKKLSSELNEIEKEIAITSHLISDQQPGVPWSFVIELTFITNPCGVRVSFSKKNGDFSLSHLSHFFYTRLVKFLAAEEVKKTVSSTSVDEETNNKISPSVPSTSGLENSASISSVTSSDKKQKEGNEIREDDDDDVASDFFDAFSDEEFLNGLDIIDAWDNTTKLPWENTEEKRSSDPSFRSRSKSGSRSGPSKRSASRSVSPDKEKKKKRDRSRTREGSASSSKTSVSRRYRYRSSSLGRSSTLSDSQREIFEEVRQKMNEVRTPASIMYDLPPSEPPSVQFLPSYPSPHPIPVYNERFSVGTSYDSGGFAPQFPYQPSSALSIPAPRNKPHIYHNFNRKKSREKMSLRNLLKPLP